MTDLKDIEIKDYQEVPVPLLRVGSAVQHDGESETALAIVAWLQSRGIGASCTPRTTSGPALVKVELPNPFEHRRESRGDLVWSGDYVFVTPDNAHAYILRKGDFEATFHAFDRNEPFPALFEDYGTWQPNAS
jgi:hypothetical protein